MQNSFHVLKHKFAMMQTEDVCRRKETTPESTTLKGIFASQLQEARSPGRTAPRRLLSAPERWSGPSFSSQNSSLRGRSGAVLG